MITPTEKVMWDDPVNPLSEKVPDEEINSKYAAGSHRIVTETNREKIPNFIDALDKEGYMEVRPFYQRRARWSRERQSQLIESFIMNVPVPPLFLYEKSYNQYEVMDGQQRITALRSFYKGEFKLEKLSIWTELNGKYYSELPREVKNGLDRRSISYIVVLKESSPNEEEAIFLRQVVFERLNTGGVKLEAQEIRNCVMQSPFNELMLDLAKTPLFRKAIDVPVDDSEAAENTAFQKMEDVEFVLRFFALRHAENYTKGMRGFLDIYMSRARKFKEKDLQILRRIFTETLELAVEVYGESLVFRPYNTKKDEWAKSPQKAFYDAVMIGFSRNLDGHSFFRENKELVIQKTKELIVGHPDGTFTGRGNSKGDVINRIELFTDMLASLKQS